jgi:hypothetical protein
VRRKVTVRIVRRGKDDDFDPAFWRDVPSDERFAEAWRLSEEIWQLKGWDPDQPGFSRSVTRLIRRRR